MVLTFSDFIFMIFVGIVIKIIKNEKKIHIFTSIFIIIIIIIIIPNKNSIYIKIITIIIKFISNK